LVPGFIDPDIDHFILNPDLLQECLAAGRSGGKVDFHGGQ